MDYVEVRLTVPPEALEAVTYLLHEHGTGGVVIDAEDVAALRVYLARDERLEARLDALRTALADLVAFFPGMAEWRQEQSLVHEEDWANAWRAYFHPTRVGARLVVAPTWSEYRAGEGELIIRLDPGMAFGTGTHPSTVLGLRALERLVRPGAVVLDVGTGSGVLAVAAALLGAGRVIALDVDPLAVRVARENVAQNGVADRVRVHHAELADLLVAGDIMPVGVVVANLTADLLCDLAATVAKVLATGGAAVGSGIVASGQSQVETAWRAVGLLPCHAEREEDWVAVWARRV